MKTIYSKMEPRFPTEITRLIYSYFEFSSDIFNVNQIRVSLVAKTWIEIWGFKGVPAPYHDEMDDPYELLEVNFDKNTTWDELEGESGVLDAKKTRYKTISATGRISSKHNWFLKTVSSISMNVSTKCSQKADFSNILDLTDNSIKNVHLFKNINCFNLTPDYTQDYKGLTDNIFSNKLASVYVVLDDVSQLKNIPVCVYCLSLSLTRQADLKDIRIPDSIETLTLEIDRSKASKPITLEISDWFGPDSKIKLISFERIRGNAEILINSAFGSLERIEVKSIININIKVPIREFRALSGPEKIVHCETMIFDHVHIGDTVELVKITGITKELYVMGQTPIDLDSVFESNLEILAVFDETGEFTKRILKNPPKKLRLFVCFDGKKTNYHFF